MKQKKASFSSGKVAYPQKESSAYRSCIGQMDTREELDARIQPSDGKYHAALSIMAAKLAYENESCIQNIVTNHWNVSFFLFCSLNTACRIQLYSSLPSERIISSSKAYMMMFKSLILSADGVLGILRWLEW